jgi:hypothetical protein
MTQKPVKLYAAIARGVQAYQNCVDSGNAAWVEKHATRVEALVREHMPSGSGVDSGTHILWSKSTSDKLVFSTSFHHMDDHGMYDGWTEHTVTVKASLGFELDVKVGGRDRNDIKDYLREVFDDALTHEISEYPEAKAVS